jgi:DNA uptake protein ComE-like DNA-binding protein
MQRKDIAFALFAAVLLFEGNLSLAADKTKAAAQPPAASQAKAGPSGARIELVDINSASKAELKKLPGITDADAAKIIAGRPYGSKAQLVSHDIIGGAVYQNLRTLIVARQTASVNGAASSAVPAAVKK